MDNEAGFSSSLLTFAAIMTFMIMVVGIFGNFLTVAALIKCPKVRNVAAAFIISLCLADLLFCALVLPFSAFRFIQGTWTHGDVLCQLIPFIQYGNIGVSLLCIGMITVNRYVMIAHHSVYGRIYKRHWIAVMIAFCWLFSYGMQLPTLLGVWGRFGYDPKLATCSIMEDDNGHSSKTTLFIIAFVIPCLIIIACYAKIFWVVHKSEQRMKKHANKQNSIPNNLRPTPTTTTAAGAGGVSSAEGGLNRISSNLASDSSCSYSTDAKLHDVLQQQKSTTRVKDQREVRAKRNEWRITKMVLAIFLSFVVCYLPITIAKVADKDVEHPGFHIFSYIMLYLSACINPIIYVIMNKQYRKAYKTVIMCEPSRLLPYIGGKTPGGSSVGEKWKDAGLSNNHSRTMVSQMSAGGGTLAAGAGTDQQEPNTSLSSSTISHQSQPIALEMTTKSTTTTSMTSPIVTKITIVPPSLPPEPSFKRETIVQNNGQPPATPPPNPPTNTTPLPRALMTIKESNRIALVGGDIILEEEEETPATTTNTNVSTNTTTMTTTTATPTEAVVSHPLDDHTTTEQLEAQKRIPFYGQNINVIPDNNDFKLNTKLKI